MINGSPALIPIIQSAGVLQSSDWTSVPIAGKSGPLTTTLGVCNNVAAFKPNGHQAQIKEFLDFAYQDKYQMAFDKEYDLLPATTSGAKALSSNSVFAPFLTALPNSVQYPSDTSLGEREDQDPADDRPRGHRQPGDGTGPAPADRQHAGQLR